MRRTLARRLLVHVALRLAAATVFLGAALVVQLREPGGFGINPFFTLIAVVYGVSLVFIATLRFVDDLPWLVDVHFAIDVLLVSACVALTGGIGSSFTPLYFLPIVAAAALQYRRGALQVAALAALVYAGLVLAQYLQATGDLEPILGFVVEGQLPDIAVAQYTVGLTVFGFFAVAFLSGSLAEGVRRADVRLERASEEIADLQFFNQYVIDSLLSGLATGDEQNRLLTFNRGAVLITGHSLASVVGRPAAEVLQLPPAFTERLREELLKARSKRADLQYRRTDGRVIHLGLSVSQLPLPDGRFGYLYTFQDVTELKRLEREAQLQKRLAAVGEMAAGIAHEIRNPLASMSGSMQMLRQELALSPEQAQLMDIVLRESERLNETIRSFLAYARPQRVDMERCDLRRVVEETATLLRNSREVGERHTIDVVVPPVEAVVDADEAQLRQIVWNLATNGLRAMPAGGRLALSVSIEAGRAILTVEDEGVGIPEAEMDGIFHPFSGSFGRGTGLGLAIVHRIASDHHASIDVQSKPEHGTIFRVSFPPALQAPASKAS